MKTNIFLTGFSGTGKTTVGRMVAQRLGWQFVDIDTEIVEFAGKPISAIFEQHGELRFRELERERLAALTLGSQQVISTGGGIVTDDSNLRTMRTSGAIVCLEAQPDTIIRRLQAQKREYGNSEIRPKLEGDNPADQVLNLKEQRQSAYALSDWTIHTDTLSEEAVVDEVIRAWSILSGRHTGIRNHQDNPAATVITSSGDYPVWVGWGILGRLGDLVANTLSAGAVYIIADEDVYKQARSAQVSLEKSRVETHLFLVPPGESNKNLDMVRHIYKWLAARKAERSHLILGVGGGVVGDLAGFVAATYLRGIKFGLIPTTVLAMMDASIGGKTGVDLPEGKNLVGAFHQPSFVIGDVQTLESLPRREFISGWAEAVKHGLILDETLLVDLETNTQSLLSLNQETTVDLVRRSVAIKAGVVSRDERETLGIRILLNYGHTIGHAIEAITGYEQYLHGEAISIGMTAAAFISNRMGLLSKTEVERQQIALENFGLPTSIENLDLNRIKEVLSVDKKTTNGKIRWVLLDRIGHAVTHSEVPSSVLDESLRSIIN